MKKFIIGVAVAVTLITVLATGASASISYLAWQQPNRSAQIFQRAYYVSVEKDSAKGYELRRFVCAPNTSSKIACVGTLYVLGTPFPITVNVSKVSAKTLRWSTQVGSVGHSSHTAPLSKYPGMR